MLMKTGILYFTTCFHGFGILRHVDPVVRMLHIYGDVDTEAVAYRPIYDGVGTEAAAYSPIYDDVDTEATSYSPII